MSGRKVLPFAAPKARVTTCEAASELCKQAGVRVLWRPDGVVNWMLPELDPALVLEG